MPDYLKPLAARIHPETQARFYGCGVPVPLALEGTTVLDMGCGTGRDCFLISQLVGEKGRVIGVDMTEEQIALAEKHLGHHTSLFGYARPNIDFRRGYMEDLASLDIADNSVDVVVSNCVFNLSPDKASLYKEVWRVLRPGGELYFSDVFADRRLPKELAQDPVLLGECLAGAQYVEDFRRTLLNVGCPDYRIVSRSPIAITEPTVANKVGNARFFSMTVRAFKLPLEDRCEDYGQIAYYDGGIPQAPHFFDLDDHHRFETGRPLAVCSNSAAMVAGTRFGRHFRIVGDTSRHFGLFDCGPSPVTAVSTSALGACC